MEFQNVRPSIVKSIKQRDLLNTWLRLYSREQRVPDIGEYHPERLADEGPDLVYYSVDSTQQPPRLKVESQDSRISAAYGYSADGRYLDEFLGERLISVLLPVYLECVLRALPVYSIFNVDDIHGRVVAIERLMLPFATGPDVTHMIVSVKAISEDGGFEIRNLMRGNAALPNAKVAGVIAIDLFHRAPGRIPVGDVIEFG